MMSLRRNEETRSLGRAKALVVLGSAFVFLFVGAALAVASGSTESSKTSTTAMSKGPITITFWEAYSGPLGETLSHLVDQFNKSQSQYKVDAVYKGTYPEVMSATIAAYRAKKPPHIAMIFDVGTATMMYSQGVYVPVHQLMKDNNISFSTSDFIGGAASYYENAQGQLDSLPFASSTPVLYYNKAMLAKIGAQPPKTWEEVGKVGQELVSQGVAKYGFTTGWPDWIMFEQYAVWNNFHYATNHNGYDGVKGVKLLINTTPFVDMVKQFAQWQDSGVYFYGGRESKASPLFVDQKVGMYIDSSATYASIAAGAKFDFAESPLPYVAQASGAPQNTVVGGNSLWVIAGGASDVYPGVAEFLHYLTSGEAQSYWGSHTGYVPVTKAGVKALTDNGFYTQHPDAHVAVSELTNKPPTPWSRGIRLGGLPEIRNLEVAALTAVLAGKQTAQAALDDAAQKGDKVLANFASQYGG